MKNLNRPEEMTKSSTSEPAPWRVDAFCYFPDPGAPLKDFAALLRFGTGAGFSFRIRHTRARSPQEACGRVEVNEPGSNVLLVAPSSMTHLLKEHLPKLYEGASIESIVLEEGGGILK